MLLTIFTKRCATISIVALGILTSPPCLACWYEDYHDYTGSDDNDDYGWEAIDTDGDGSLDSLLFIEYSNDNDNNCDDNDWYWDNDDEKDDDWWWGNDDNVTGDDCDEEYTEVSGGSSGGYSSSDRSGSKGTEGNEKKSDTPSNPTTSTSEVPTSKTPDLKQISNINPFLSLPSLPGSGIKSLDNEENNFNRKEQEEDEGSEDEGNELYPIINLVNEKTWDDAGYEYKMENVIKDGKVVIDPKTQKAKQKKKVTCNCLCCAEKVLKNYNLGKGSSANVIQVVYETWNTKNIGNKKVKERVLADYKNKENVQTAKQCILRHLKAGNPILVGVNHTLATTKGLCYNDGATDHFFVITGSGHDEKGNYFSYVETGRLKDQKAGAIDSKTNRLYYNENTQRWVDPSDHNGKVLTLTQVRPLDGDTSGTAAQIQADTNSY